MGARPGAIQPSEDDTFLRSVTFSSGVSPSRKKTDTCSRPHPGVADFAGFGHLTSCRSNDGGGRIFTPTTTRNSGAVMQATHGKNCVKSML